MLIGIEVFFCYFLPLFWKINSKIHAGEMNKNICIYTVGESTAFGQPYGPKISFPEIVKYMFNGKINNKEIRIINFARRGSSFEEQYWKLFKELSVKPKLTGVVFVYAGINDISTVGKGLDKAGFCFRTLYKSLVYSKFAFIKHKKSIYSYEYNLERVIKLAQSYGLKIVISNLIGNFTEFAPKNNQIFESKDNRALFNKAEEYVLKGDLDKAQNVYEQLINLNHKTVLSPVYYFLGKIYEAKGDYAIARNNYYLAADTGSVRLQKPTSKQNEIIKMAGIEYKAGFVDALSIFEENSKNGLIGYNLCGDAHHPNLKGYILLAKGFARELGDIYGNKPERTDLSEKEVTEHFNFTDDDIFYVYTHNLKWLLAETSGDIYRKESIERARYYLEQAIKNYELNPSGEKKTDIELSRLMIAAVSRDLKGVIYWLEKGEFLTKNRTVFFTTNNNMIQTNNWFTSWLRYTLCELDLPDAIIKELGADLKEHERLKNNRLDYVIVK